MILQVDYSIISYNFNAVMERGKHKVYYFAVLTGLP